VPSKSEEVNHRSWKDILFERQKGLCYYCDIPLNRERLDREHLRPDSLTVDHFVPKCFFPKGYDHYGTGNVVVACFRCNSNKGNTIPGAKEMGDDYVTYLNYKDNIGREND